MTTEILKDSTGFVQLELPSPLLELARGGLCDAVVRVVGAPARALAQEVRIKLVFASCEIIAMPESGVSFEGSTRALVFTALSVIGETLAQQRSKPGLLESIMNFSPPASGEFAQLQREAEMRNLERRLAQIDEQRQLGLRAHQFRLQKLNESDFSLHTPPTLARRSKRAQRNADRPWNRKGSR